MIDHSYSKHSPLYGSGGSRGGAQGARGPPLFLDQTEARRPKKIFLENTPPLSQGLDDRPPPSLAEGLDPPLYGALRLNRCLSQAA